MTNSALDPADDADRFHAVRETDLDQRDVDRIIAPVAGGAWIAMALVAYVWPGHFGAGARWAHEFAVVFGIVGLLLLAGSAGPKALASKTRRLAPWFLFVVLAAEIWLIGPVKSPL